MPGFHRRGPGDKVRLEISEKAEGEPQRPQGDGLRNGLTKKRFSQKGRNGNLSKSNPKCPQEGRIRGLSNWSKEAGMGVLMWTTKQVHGVLEGLGGGTWMFFDDSQRPLKSDWAQLLAHQCKYWNVRIRKNILSLRRGPEKLNNDQRRNWNTWTEDQKKSFRESCPAEERQSHGGKRFPKMRPGGQKGQTRG